MIHYGPELLPDLDPLRIRLTLNTEHQANTMSQFAATSMRVFVVFYLSLSASVSAADELDTSLNPGAKRRGYSKGELIPVSCLNRTM